MLEDAHQIEAASEQRRPNIKADRNELSTAQDQLRAKGFIPIQWHGKCEADKVSMGTYPVAAGYGGMYGLVFDNTFSKQFSKTVTFVLLTYPSNSPPHSTHHLQNLPGASLSLPSLGKPQSPNLVALASESVDSLQNLAMGHTVSRGNSEQERNDSQNGFMTYHVGVLRNGEESEDKAMHGDFSRWILRPAHCHTITVVIHLH